jgi:hypothetical protein
MVSKARKARKVILENADLKASREKEALKVRPVHRAPADRKVILVQLARLVQLAQWDQLVRPVKRVTLDHRVFRALKVLLDHRVQSAQPDRRVRKVHKDCKESKALRESKDCLV